MNKEDLQTFRNEIREELTDILSWWVKHAPDKTNGGFFGKIANNNKIDEHAPKGLVLHARILYTFSAAYQLTANRKHLAMAEHAYQFINKHFVDKEYGGFYWSLNTNGEVAENKKQIYGQAFAIYALAEFYKISRNDEILNLATQTFNNIEEHSLDKQYHGYLEAFTRRWLPIEDLRLSEKDQNEKKTMNTHLHVIEAYSNLYSVWPNQHLKNAIVKLLAIFEKFIIDKNSYHLNLFFAEDWTLKSSVYSFGHDIEAAWLLQESAEIINDELLIIKFKTIAIQLTKAAARGLNDLDALRNEYNFKTAHWDNEIHWWPQAEAMVGFYNSWQITQDENYFSNCVKTWQFIKKYLKNEEYGEWFWGLNAQNSILVNEEKAGFWKCPYHNGRACMELLKRTNIST